MTRAPMDAVCVVWWDAAGNSERRAADVAGDLDAMGPARVCSVGFLVREDERCVVIVQDYWDDHAGRSWRSWLAVPRGCIVQVHRLYEIQAMGEAG